MALTLSVTRSAFADKRPRIDGRFARLYDNAGRPLPQYESLLREHKIHKKSDSTAPGTHDDDVHTYTLIHILDNDSLCESDMPIVQMTQTTFSWDDSKSTLSLIYKP